MSRHKTRRARKGHKRSHKTRKGSRSRGLVRRNPSSLSFNGIAALAALAFGIYWYKNRLGANPT